MTFTSIAKYPSNPVCLPISNPARVVTSQSLNPCCRPYSIHQPGESTLILHGFPSSVILHRESSVLASTPLPELASMSPPQALVPSRAGGGGGRGGREDHLPISICRFHTRPARPCICPDRSSRASCTPPGGGGGEGTSSVWN